MPPTKRKQRLFQKGHKIMNTGRTRFKKGHIPWNSGIRGIFKHSEETKNKMKKSAEKVISSTRFKKGQIPWNKGKKGVQKPYWLGKKRPNISERARIRALRGGKSGKCEECGNKIWLTPWKQKNQKHYFCSLQCRSVWEIRSGVKRGENSPSWKGGITPLVLQIRHSFKYRQWRDDVFTRDDFICQKCGEKGKYLEAHHIKEFSKIIYENKIITFEGAMDCEELWSINNGITYCLDCHNKTKRNYGTTNGN